ncbi:MAG: type IV toxin-antitoxin system AbiEi family antitoxin domain-containing protein, partial [Muribaculaceae bacterium]|nr:type IV toxin-antitoxin system AbiEi family antitoxin domain-containing protein [Muribaculaceae bacterium]
MEVVQKNIMTTIADTIKSSNNGSLFFSNSFPAYGDEYVGHIMSDLVKEGELYRIGRGVYLKTKKTKFGLVYPDLEYIAKAIAKRDNADILPTGAMALNILGLSTQVPMKPT